MSNSRLRGHDGVRDIEFGPLVEGAAKQRETVRSWWICVVLMYALAAAVALADPAPASDNGAAEAADDTLRFAVAEHQALRAKYENCEYKATRHTAGDMVKGLNSQFDITTVFTIKIVGRSVLATSDADGKIVVWAKPTKEDPGAEEGEVRKGHTVSRALVNSKRIAYWSDVAKPDIDLYYAEDWPAKGRGMAIPERMNGILEAFDVRMLPFCPSGLSMLESYLPSRGHAASSNSITWKVERRTDPNNVPVIEVRRRRARDADDDLVFTLLPSKNCVVSEGCFRLGAKPDGFTRKVKLDYQQIDGIGFPRSVETTEMKTPPAASVLTTVTFSEVKIIADKPSRELDLADLDIPDGAVLTRNVPTGLPDNLHYIWKGGEMTQINVDSVQRTNGNQ